MPHTEVRATVPEDVDIFEEIGRATGEEQLAAIPVAAPVTERPGAQPVEQATTEARVPGAPPAPGAPVEARADVDDMRAAIHRALVSADAVRGEHARIASIARMDEWGKRLALLFAELLPA